MYPRAYPRPPVFIRELRKRRLTFNGAKPVEVEFRPESQTLHLTTDARSLDAVLTFPLPAADLQFEAFVSTFLKSVPLSMLAAVPLKEGEQQL